jgi:hypothetical protein
MSAIPTVKVMQQLNAARDDLGKLNVNDLIRSLSDSLNFLGSANIGMVNKRRALIKNELPPNMQLLCNGSQDFSGSALFGNTLSSDIKEVSELNKVSNYFKGRGRAFYRGGSRGMIRRGFTRGVFRRGGRGIFKRRAYPMTTSARGSKKSPLNSAGPSR